MSDANKPKADGPTLTDRDVEILVAAIRSTEGGLARVSRILLNLILSVFPRILNPASRFNPLDAFCFP